MQPLPARPVSSPSATIWRTAAAASLVPMSKVWTIEAGHEPLAGLVALADHGPHQPVGALGRSRRADAVEPVALVEGRHPVGGELLQRGPHHGRGQTGAPAISARSGKWVPGSVHESRTHWRTGCTSSSLVATLSAVILRPLSPVMSCEDPPVGPHDACAVPQCAAGWLAATSPVAGQASQDCVHAGATAAGDRLRPPLGRSGGHHAQQAIHDGTGSGTSHYRLSGQGAPLPLRHGVLGKSALVSDPDPGAARTLVTVLQLRSGQDHFPRLRADARVPRRRVFIEVAIAQTRLRRGTALRADAHLRWGKTALRHVVTLHSTWLSAFSANSPHARGR